MPTTNDDLPSIIARVAERLTTDFMALANKVQSWQRRQVDLEAYDIETRHQLAAHIERQHTDHDELSRLKDTVLFQGTVLWILILTALIGMSGVVAFLLIR